jgi:glutamate-1-semialdehyde aminotransferase
MISEQRESLFISDEAITGFISATSDAQEHFLLS